MTRFARMWSRLDEEMATHRAEIDTELDALFAHDVRVTDYLFYLARLHGFVAPLECALGMTPGITDTIDVRGRARLHDLAADLLALGMRPAELAVMPVCTEVPVFDDVADALGWLYIIERQMLAHRDLCAHLARQMPRECAGATAYIGRTDAVHARHWRELCDALDDTAIDELTARRITRAADDGHRCYRRWCGRDPDVRAAG